MGDLKISTEESRGNNYILTKMPAEQIGALLAKRLQAKEMTFIQDAKNPAKFIYKDDLIDL